jgi:CxxC motif-containing protein (DUF1111 family)
VRCILLLLVLLAAACDNGGDTPPATEQNNLGGPRPGLSPDRLAAFERGREIFVKRFTQDEGHGPDFNTNSCRSCHEFPAIGGSSPRYRNFYIAKKSDGSNFFENDQLVARTFSYERPVRESMAGAAVQAQRNAPPLFGIGFLERIPSTDIRANADAFDDDDDGISGRFNIDDGLTGRFGFKAQESNLEAFIRAPIFNHMGITTNPLTSTAQATIPQEPTTDDDGVPDPEMGREDLSDLLTFLQELDAPAPLPMDDVAMRGEEVFTEIGCAKCHIPNIVTDGEPVFAYTDMLLHEMGATLNDGISMGIATGAEFRTQPLWGLRHHAPYLHDGRADTIHDAIDLHGGEAQPARDAYSQLPESDRAALLRFLETR